LDNKWSDFPLHASFVPFLHEAVRYLASGRAHASEYLVGALPPGVQKTPGLATLGDRPGGGSTRRIAVNVDARESDSTRMSIDDFQAAVARLDQGPSSEARAEARQQEDRQHLWQYGIAVMALLLVAEGVLAARTA